MRNFVLIVMAILIVLCTGCSKEKEASSVSSHYEIDRFINKGRELSQVSESAVLKNSRFDGFTALRLSDIIMEEYWGEEAFKNTITVIKEYREYSYYVVERIPIAYGEKKPIYRVILDKSGAIVHVEKVEPIGLER